MGCGASADGDARALHEQPFDSAPTEEEIRAERARHKHSDEPEIKPAICYKSTTFDHVKRPKLPDLGVLQGHDQVLKFYGETFHDERVDLTRLSPAGNFTVDFEVLADTASHSHHIVHDDLWHYYASGGKKKEFDQAELRAEVHDAQGHWKRKIRRHAHKIRHPHEENPHVDPHGRDASKQACKSPTAAQPSFPGSPKGPTSPKGPASPKGPGSPKSLNSPSRSASPGKRGSVGSP